MKFAPLSEEIWKTIVKETATAIDALKLDDKHMGVVMLMVAESDQPPQIADTLRSRLVVITNLTTERARGTMAAALLQLQGRQTR